MTLYFLDRIIPTLISFSAITCGNGQVKPPEKDYVNVKPVRPVYVLVVRILQKTKHTNFGWKISNVRIFSMLSSFWNVTFCQSIPPS